MEMINLPFNFNFTTLLLLSSFIFLLIKAFKKPKSPKNLPPSPPKLPVIGHLHHLAGELAHRGLRKLSQEHGPIISLKLGQVDAVVISSREASREVLKTHDPAFCDRPGSIALKILWYNQTDLAFCNYDDYWRQMRKICILEMLSAKNVKSFGYIRQDEISRLVEFFHSSSGQPVNFSDKISAFMSTITCRAAFGKVLGDRDELIALVNTASSMAGGFELADFFPSFTLLHLFSRRKFTLLRMRKKIDAILDRIVEEHRFKQSGEYDGEDIVDTLLRVQNTGELNIPITIDNIKAIILDMFAAGTETSSITVGWIMTELMKNPRVMAKLQEEIRGVLKGKTRLEESDVQGLKYMKLVIKESMRYHPPVPLIPRQCKDECNVQGYTIPVKTRVMVNVWAMGRNSEYWEDPEIFYPERFEKVPRELLGNDFEITPFGAGRRICPGLNFGLANVEFPLAQLLYHFDWKLPQGMSPADVDTIEVEALTVGRKNPLILVPTIYKPSFQIHDS